jgi:hypothetical protein
LFGDKVEAESLSDNTGKKTTHRMLLPFSRGDERRDRSACRRSQHRDNWLAWQLGMPAIHLDLFVVQNVVAGPIARRVADLGRCMTARGDRPIIVEGVLLLEALDEVGRSPDFLIFVDEQPSARVRPPDSDLIDTREFSLTNQVDRYFSRRSPADSADFRLRGYAAL